jgi:hypothetical protein
MKNQFIVILIFVFIKFSLFCQVIYSNVQSDGFKSLVENGIIYIPSGKTEIDEPYINSLEENWKFSKLSIYDSEAGEKISPNQIVVFEAKINDRESILALIPYSFILKESVSKYACLGYICLNGFNQSSDDLSKQNFLNQYVIGLNDAFVAIKTNNISKFGVPLYKELYNYFLPKSKVLKNKTLLIVDNTKSYIDLNALKKNGINYKLITLDEFALIDKEDLSSFCLMYFAYNSFTEISIFDLEKNELIYSKHFASAKLKFSGSDIKKISALWK